MPVAPRAAERIQLLRLALVIVAALALVGCEPEQEPDDVALTQGLLVLSGDIGDLRLDVRDAESPSGRPVPLPDPATTWVSAGRTNVLLATLIDGRTFVSDPLGADDPEWRLVEAVTVDDEPPITPRYYGAWDPPGGAYVQLGGNFAAGDGSRIVVTDPTLLGATENDLGSRTILAVPPAWIDDDRVMVLGSNDGEPESLIVDTTSGDIRDGPAGSTIVTTSADASTTAVWRGTDATVEVLETAAWLAGDSAAIGIDAPESGLQPAVIALDGTGGRIAVVWSEADGSGPRITVHAASREWRRVATIEPGAVSAASVAWLR
jgi:hypothetical protein